MSDFKLVKASPTPEEGEIIALRKLLRDVTEGMLKACESRSIKLRQELTTDPVGTIIPHDMSLVLAERLLVLDRLERFGGDVKSAAESLDVHQQTIYEIRGGARPRGKFAGKDWRKGVRGPCQRNQ